MKSKKVNLTDEEMTMLYIGTINAQKTRKALDEAENVINAFLEPEDGTKKYLYITNPDGTRFKIEYGAKISECTITPSKRG